MKIDMHVHTSEYSGCAISPERLQIASAKRKGLDAVCITDHGHLCESEHVFALNEAHAPFLVFSAVEITVKNYGEDFIVIGVQDRRLSERKWDYEDLYDFTREKNGYIFFCHPYRYYDEPPRAIYKRVPDALEMYSVNINGGLHKKIARLAGELGVLTLANSDAHTAGDVGAYYNEINYPVKTDKELVLALKKGDFTPKI